MKSAWITAQFLSLFWLSLNLGADVVAGIYFNSMGYEHCVFNLVEHNHNPTIFSYNLIQYLLVRSQGNQAWTIVQSDAANELRTLAKVHQHRHLKLNCTVSIVIVAGNCSENSLKNLYEALLVLVENTLIVVVAESKNYYIYNKIKLSTSSFDYSYKFLVSRKLQISSVHSLCPRCSPALNVFEIPDDVNKRSLAQLQTFTSIIRRISLEPLQVAFFTLGLKSRHRHGPRVIQAFKFLYMREHMRQYIGPNPEAILMENAALFLNFTLFYLDRGNPMMVAQKYYLLKSPQDFVAVAVLALGEPLHEYWQHVPPSHYAAYTVSVVHERFLYCVEKDERESFNFLFWAVPLDPWSWVGLGTSCILLTISLRGEWFQIYSILMRQSCTVLERNRILILFILATIIFTYGYEGVISSYLTVLPPIVVLKTVRELIESGYQVIGPNRGQEYPELELLLKRENLSRTLAEISDFCG